ncbi:hypothetical protein L2E82_45112 [Cichorium intybus]|uniref:Uncharacterized protein n=1 Tax=Cichorium intybus TaxID=13427 RepID=A0ACB8ZSE5_CICIN|nr:hypothetical protein L2E82_45112 [Cichorium intybus]
MTNTGGAKNVGAGEWNQTRKLQNRAPPGPLPTILADVMMAKKIRRKKTVSEWESEVGDGGRIYQSWWCIGSGWNPSRSKRGGGLVRYVRPSVSISSVSKLNDAVVKKSEVEVDGKRNTSETPNCNYHRHTSRWCDLVLNDI